MNINCILIVSTMRNDLYSRPNYKCSEFGRDLNFFKDLKLSNLNRECQIEIFKFFIKLEKVYKILIANFIRNKYKLQDLSVL